ncbi:hypothetical protein LCGC14_0175150 [marine sediment metagenome]|uniref:Uncharacterized protein n=1 Tax=marine sediment metagenome TaxID=412755 RepID=A0A0F9X9I5_9ZZZZ
MECKHVLKLELGIIEQNILRAILGNISAKKIEEMINDANKKNPRLNLPLDETHELIESLFAVFTPAYNMLDEQKD